MWNIFKRPINKATLEAWAKIFEDCAKVAILAIPVILFGKEEMGFRIYSSISLMFAVYFCLVFARKLRDDIERKSQEEQE